MVWRSPTVQIAADTLVSRAISRSWEKTGRLKDDMTCVVVDLNPSQRAACPPAGPADGTAGCCVVA